MDPQPTGTYAFVNIKFRVKFFNLGWLSIPLVS